LKNHTSETIIVLHYCIFQTFSKFVFNHFSMQWQIDKIG